MTLKASKSRKTPTLQQNTYKGLGSRTCRIDPVNPQNIKVAQQRWHITFLCAEYFYFHEQHLFSCINPLLLCYKILNMDRTIFLRFFGHFYVFDRKSDKGHSHLTKRNFDSVAISSFHIKFYETGFISKLCTLKISKNSIFFSFKNVGKLTRQPPASRLTTTHIVTSS